MLYSPAPMLDLRKIRAIGLDLDDTLWPIWPTIERAEAQLFQWLHPHAPGAAQVIADTRQRMQLREALALARPDLVHDMSAMRRELIRMALARCEEDTGLADPAFEVFFEHRMRVDLFDDAL
ncbi:MAG: HAD family hydrolase, partial [Rhodoferax sp.]|nr:HAD family hydrolase [Rhodoferax sp.]